MSLSAAVSNPWALLALPAALYALLAVVVGRRQSWPGEIKLAVAGTGMVLIAVWLMSFDALMAFFRAAYVSEPLNALGPVAIDGEMAVGTVVWIAVGQSGVKLAELRSWRDGARWALSPRPYIALLVAVSAGLSSIANAVHPLTSDAAWYLPAPWSYAGSAVPGVVMFAVIHQLVILFRVLRSAPAVVVIEARADRPDRTGPNRTGEPPPGQSVAGSLPGPSNPRALPAARVTEAMWAEALSALGPDATNEQLGERLGCHPDSVRRYRRRFAAVRGLPRVVSSDG